MQDKLKFSLGNLVFTSLFLTKPDLELKKKKLNIFIQLERKQLEKSKQGTRLVEIGWIWTASFSRWLKSHDLCWLPTFCVLSGYKNGHKDEPYWRQRYDVICLIRSEIKHLQPNRLLNILLLLFELFWRIERIFRSENFFLLDFFSKNFDRQDRLYQIWAFYDFPFLRYNRLDFPLKRLFPLRHFVRVANKKQNFKNWQHVLDFQKIFCGRGIVKQSTVLETKNLMLFNKWKSAFPKLIFCHNTD